MIKLAKSNKVLRLIACTLTALFVSLSFMGCPSLYGTDLPDTDTTGTEQTEQTEQTETETGTDSTTTTVEIKNFYVLVSGSSDELNMKAETKTYTDKQVRNIITNQASEAFDTIEEVKTYILSKHVSMITWATLSEIDAALRDVWQFIDDNYENNNKITIIWQEPYENMKFKIVIYDMQSEVNRFAN